MSVCEECGKSICRFEDCKFLHIGNCRYCHPEYHDTEFIPQICVNIDEWIDDSVKNKDLRQVSMGYDAKIDWYERYHPSEVETIIDLYERMITIDIEAGNVKGQAIALQKLTNFLDKSSEPSSYSPKDVYWRIFEAEKLAGDLKDQLIALNHLSKLILVDGSDEKEMIEFIKLRQSFESEDVNENYTEYVGTLLSLLFNCEPNFRSKIDHIVVNAISKIDDDFIRDLFYVCHNSINSESMEDYGEGIYTWKLDIGQSNFLYTDNITLLKISPNAVPNSPITEEPTVVVDLPNVLNSLMFRSGGGLDPIGAFVDYLDEQSKEKSVQIVLTFGVICEYPIITRELFGHSGVQMILPLLSNKISQDLSFVAMARSSKNSIIITEDRLRDEQKSHPGWVQRHVIHSLTRFKVTNRGFITNRRK